MVKRRQEGFGALALLGIVVVVMVVITAIVMVWANQQKQPQTAQSGQSSTATDTPATSNQPTTKYLIISEWDLRVKPITRLPDLTYTIYEAGSDGTPARAALSVTGLPAECSGYYWIARAKAGENLDGNGHTAQQLRASNPKSVQQVGQYYYYLQHATAPCSSNSAFMATWAGAMADFAGTSGTDELILSE